MTASARTVASGVPLGAASGGPDDAVLPHWDFPRGTAGIGVVVAFGAEHGVTARALLNGTGLTPETLDDPSTVVPAAVELRVLSNLAAALPGRDALGWELGCRYHVTTFGILGFALMSSRTVGEAFTLAFRFLDLSHIFSTPTVTVESDEVRIGLAAYDLPDAVARLVVERDLTAILTVLGELVPGGMPVTELVSAWPAPRGVVPDVDGRAPRFGGRTTGFAFAAELLDRPLPQGNPHSLAVAEGLCRDVVSQRRRTPGLSQRVRVWVTQNVAYGADAAGAARALGLSERTLRRRLGEEGTGFRRLLDEVRATLAEQLLAQQVLTVDDVAQRLGYAEASSFIHAFKRWRGVTPHAFRQPASGS